MTNTDRVSLVANVQRISDALQQAQADVALLTRLKNSEADVKRLSAELTKAQDELSDIMTKEVQAKIEARYAGLQDITITERVPEKSGGVLHSAFVITVTRDAFNGYENVPEERTYTGFQQLPDDALAYLIERRPERIPESIMALAPNDPEEAFNTYIMGRRRGYLNIRASA